MRSSTLGTKAVLEGRGFKPKFSVTKFMKVGDRVRVKQSVVIYHHPEHRNEAFDMNGSEGLIHNILNDWQGRPISPNMPIHVEFKAQRKFTVHFRPDELEAIAEDA